MTAHVALVGAVPDSESSPRHPDPQHVAARPDPHAPPPPLEPHGHPSAQDGRTPGAEEPWTIGVVESLRAAFPEIPEPDIRDCVARLRVRFANARIRTYIPILVARQARAVLAGYSPTGAGALVG